VGSDAARGKIGCEQSQKARTGLTKAPTT